MGVRLRVGFVWIAGAIAAAGIAAPQSAQAAAHDGAHHAVPAEGPTLAQWAKGALPLDGLGAYHRKITTDSAEAQAYFDQGLRLIYAFNHDEAARSFARAVQLDPACASCYWGAAVALGPNYNVPMLPDRWRASWEAVQLAQRNAPHAAPVEQALIAAIAKRQSGPEPRDPAAMAPFQRAYAEAMAEVARRFPADDDVQVFHAEALMTANPWKLWSLDGKPAPGTAEIVATLERVLARNPGHPGANHYYIHAVEASPHPERAVAAAERLGPMMPSAGHLVHMPAHIFQLVGRYEDAAQANRDGAAADERYMAKAKPPAYSYYAMYLAHNFQFLAYSAAMEGRSAEAIDAARKSRGVIPEAMLTAMPGMDYFVSEIYPALVRFGRWDAILAEPAPRPEFKGLSGQYRFARAVAYAAKAQIAQAEAEKRALDAILAEVPPELPAGLNTARDVLGVASLVAAARIAQARGDEAAAIRDLRAAVEREDRLAYDEPRSWFLPTRHMLGAALLSARQAEAAEAVYRADLRRNPRNGWALYGLAAALRTQGRAAEARKTDADFAAAWTRADVKLAASAF